MPKGGINAQAKELKPLRVPGMPVKAKTPKGGINAQAKKLKPLRVPGSAHEVQTEEEHGQVRRKSVDSFKAERPRYAYIW